MKVAGLLAIAWAAFAAEWPAHVITTNFRTNTATAGDFTGDGLVDVIANEGPGRKDVLFVAPDWKPVVVGAGANSIYSLALDMDADGDLDYVAAQYQPGLLYWLERPADAHSGAWRMHVIDDASKGGLDGIHSLAKADVNRDGKADLIAGSGQPKGAFPNSAVWFEAPKWTRHVFAGKDAPGLNHYLGTGDVNGDGRIDIALAGKNVEGGNWFAYWEQPRDARSLWRKHLVAEKHEGASNILVADVNGDRKPDLIGSRGHGKGVLWFEAPTWTAREIDAAIEYPHSLIAADLDGDGDVDAAACSAVYSRKPESPVLAWYENDGKGRFHVHRISENQASYHASSADMDGDGDLDLLVAGQESRNVVWYENKLKR